MGRITSIVVLPLMILLAIIVSYSFYIALINSNICYNVTCRTGLLPITVLQYVAAQDGDEDTDTDDEDTDTDDEDTDTDDEDTDTDDEDTDDEGDQGPRDAPFTPPPDQGPRDAPFTPPPSPFKIYLNPNFGIRIQYQPDWQIVEYPDHIVFTSPPASASDIHTETLGVYLLSSDTTLLSESINQRINSYRSSLPNFMLIESNPTTLAGNPAYMIGYNFYDSSVGLARSKEVVTRYGNNEYAILYTAKSEDYPENEFTINRMITSFQITR